MFGIPRLLRTKSPSLIYSVAYFACWRNRFGVDFAGSFVMLVLWLGYSFPFLLLFHCEFDWIQARYAGIGVKAGSGISPVVGARNYGVGAATDAQLVGRRPVVQQKRQTPRAWQVQVGEDSLRLSFTCSTFLMFETANAQSDKISNRQIDNVTYSSLHLLATTTDFADYRTTTSIFNTMISPKKMMIRLHRWTSCPSRSPSLTSKHS